MSIYGPSYDAVMYALGRYSVWYDEAEDKHIYYSVRARTNIDLEQSHLLEVRNRTTRTSGAFAVHRYIYRYGGDIVLCGSGIQE